MTIEEDLITRLRTRARIRRSIDNRKSVQLGEPDRIADLLEEAAKEIERAYAQEGELLIELDALHFTMNNFMRPREPGEA